MMRTLGGYLMRAEPASQLAARMESLASQQDLQATAALVEPFVAEVDMLRKALKQTLAA